MPFFPAFIDISGKEILVVGGGEVATRKVEKLLPFGGRITVVAPKITKRIKELWRDGKINLRRRKFLVGDLRNKKMVIVAVNDLRLQERIFRLCERRGILCNSVDSPEFCSFIFPALVVKGDLVIGISTSGKAPALSRRLRELFESCLPDDIDSILKTVENRRRELPKGKARQKAMIDLSKRLIAT